MARSLARSLIFKPKDSTKREHVGAISRVCWLSPAEDFAILELADDATALGPCQPGQFEAGTSWRFCGRWADNPEKGYQFKFEIAVPHLGHGRKGIESYLVKTCDGIGEKTARRLYDKYGGEAVSKLRLTPDDVAAEMKLDPAVCLACSNQLADAQQFEGTRIDLFNLLSGKGFSGKLIEAVIARMGVKAPAMIRKNPFVLLPYPSASIKRCDKLWTEFGLPANAMKRQSICAWHLVKTDNNGHTWHTATSVAEKLRMMVPGCEPVRAFKLALRARMLKKLRDAAGVLWLADYRQAAAEESIVRSVVRLRSQPSLWPIDQVPISQVEGDRLPSVHQVEQLTHATQEAVGALLGGPGTGKSHTFGYLLREVIAVYGRSSIVVCAPTGKAAVRATQAMQLAGLDIQARTIHSTLKIGRNGHDGEGWGFLHNEGNPLEGKFFVVDEWSMVDVALQAAFLAAIPTGANVLFIGDGWQLPPVGPGAPLRDMIDADIPHGELTQVRRNAGQIVHACVRIKNRESFETAARIDLAAEIPQNLKLLEARDATHSREVLVELVKRMTLFNPTWQTQVIVARNTKGEIARTKLNEVLHPLLNPDGYSAPDNPFKVGDKLICLRNSYMTVVEPMGRYRGEHAEAMGQEAANYRTVYEVDDQGEITTDPKELYLANGEIGRVVAVGKGVAIARFSESDDLIKIPMGKAKPEDEEEGEGDAERGRGCNFDHAYAITVHKAQGSESPCVIIMADPDAGRLCDQSWWYTAISRASKLCIIIGQMRWVDQQRMRQAMVKRKTFLKELLLEALAREEEVKALTVRGMEELGS